MNQNQRDADMSLAETWAPLGWLCALCAPAQRAALHGQDKVVLSPACRCQAHDNEVGSGDQRLPTPGDLGTKNLGMGGDQHSEQRREAQEAVWLSAAHRDTASTGLGVRCTRGSASSATRR